MTESWVKLPASDGYAVPLQVFRAQEPAQNTRLLILPALGISASFYQPFASALAQRGFNTAVIEQRGHGESSLRASRKVNFGFRDILCEDIPLSLDWVEQNLPGDKQVLIGHSLGGHLAAMSTALHAQRIHGLVLSGCGSPWIQAYQGKTRMQVQVLLKLVQISTALLGYYPGDRLGFGGREAAQLMKDWGELAKHNRYSAHGLEIALDAAIAEYPKPVLALLYDRDSFAPQSASNAVTQKFTAATLTEQLISSEELGRKADHYAWVRQADVTANAIQLWLDTAGV